MSAVSYVWKPNWEETRQHMLDWWNQSGLVVGMWGDVPAEESRKGAITQVPQPTGDAFFLAGAERARQEHHQLAGREFPADILPVIAPEMGPGSLCLHLGAKADFSKPDTVWFHPVFSEVDDVSDIPDLVFTGTDPYWKATEAYLNEAVRLAEGKHFVGLPDLCNDMDILASMRDPNNLLLDLLEEPEWVKASLAAINKAYKDVYERIRDIVDPGKDRGTLNRTFYIWGPGRTGKLQCDTSAMFSREMFAEFATPCLTDLCDWLDHPLYHLDGTDAVRHLDELLQIESLKAIEWTPEAGKPGGAHPQWHAMYRRILEAGKSLQVVYLKPHEVPGLLDAIGTQGVYLMPEFTSVKEVRQLMEIVDRDYR